MDERGLPPTHAAVRKMAGLLLYERKGEVVSERWITDGLLDSLNDMILYQNTLTNMITSVQNAKIQKSSTNGLILVRNTIVKYDILEQGIYNFDETGFQIGVAHNMGGSGDEKHPKWHSSY
jgi:hypothetical protein